MHFDQSLSRVAQNNTQNRVSLLPFSYLTKITLFHLNRVTGSPDTDPKAWKSRRPMQSISVPLRNTASGIALLLALHISACHPPGPAEAAGRGPAGPSEARQITLDNTTPTVDISGYTLITGPGEDRNEDATRILETKRKWPLAMQSLEKAAFEEILARGFTFAGDGQLMNRADYIADRTTPSEWKITHVQYDNLTLQFFGDIGVLSYRNRVTNENTETGATEIEYIDWVDVYVQENGQWKIGSAHVVDFRMEPVSNK